MKSIAAPVPARVPRLAGAVGELREAWRSRLLWQAAGFAALAVFVTVRWVSLVAQPPIGRALAAVAIATVGGVAIARAGGARGGWTARSARLAMAGVTLAAGLVVMGLPPRLLLPTGWDELGVGINRATGAFSVGQWPYDGPDDWIRLGTLLIAPVVLTAAATLAFWPARGRQAPRALAAAALVGLYGGAIAQGQPRAPLVAGLALFAGVVALLFLPNARRRTAVPAITMLLCVAMVAVPLAGRLPAGNPVIDYNALASLQRATFDWDHSYGPLDWPRRDALVFRADSARPHYWKAITLDRFDGFRWIASTTGYADVPGEVPHPVNKSWVARAKVTIGALDGDLLLAPGAILSAGGLDSFAIADDGTGRSADELPEGTAYTVRAYAPDPSVEQMRAASARVPAALGSYTRIEMPADYALDYSAQGEGSLAAPAVTLPPVARGFGPRTADVRRVLDSPYARTYRLARDVAAGAPTTYDAVLRIQQYLRQNYRYSEQPPTRTYPLPAFLFQDRIGYCQQFSGAMALMLRMNGIPARVAGGFAPGQRVGRRAFEVRDTDAHSWVEVWFAGIGWVPFDPTPPAAPALAGVLGRVTSTAVVQLGADVAAGRFTGTLHTPGRGTTSPAGVGPTRGGGSAAAPHARRVPSEAGAGAPTLALALALAALCCLAAVRWAWRQRARLAATDAIDEVRAAFAAAGTDVGGATLSELERRLRRAGHDRGADYLAALRDGRYRDASGRASRRGRGALRRAVATRRGAPARLRAWLAVPPRLRRR